jgi:hypothetical protein
LVVLAQLCACQHQQDATGVTSLDGAETEKFDLPYEDELGGGAPYPAPLASLSDLSYGSCPKGTFGY